MVLIKYVLLKNEKYEKKLTPILQCKYVPEETCWQ